jgi:hypothetical protein
VVLAQPRLQTGGGDPLADRRALATGDDETVETIQVIGGTNLARLGAELVQNATVGLEVALDR